MTLVHPAEDISLSPALHREPNTGPQKHIELVPVQGTTYSCPECKHLSPTMDSFKKHLQNTHPKSQTACKSCHKVYKTVKNLRRHEKSHAKKVEGEPEKTKVRPQKRDLPCLHCHKKFSTQTALHWHVERNHIDMQKTSTCRVCGKELSDHASLKRHLEMVHSLESASCSVCKKTFKSFINLQRHMNVTHPPEEAAQTCDTCNKTFKCSLHLRIHIRTVHAEETVFKCDMCNKEFPLKKYMLKHKKTHVAVKAFPCSVCGKMFKNSQDAKRHTKQVHMKDAKKSKEPSICEICNKEFSFRKYMLLHKKIHVDVKSYSCEFCSKLFKCAGHVRKHTKRLHLNPLNPIERVTCTTFICDVCKKSFTSKKNMAKHIKIHFATKVLPCGICDKLFKSNSEVNKHLRRVHMKGLVRKNETETITNTVNTTKTHNTEYNTEHALTNIEYTENVLANTKYTVKALEITEYTDEVPRSEDYRLETLRSAEYILETLGNTEYTLEPLKSTGGALGIRGFIEEALVSTEYAKEPPKGTDFTEEALRNTEFTEDVTDSAEHTDKALHTKLLKVVDECTNNPEFANKVTTVKALRNKDILKDAIEISDFTMEDLGITEESVESTQEAFERADIIETPGSIECTNEVSVDIEFAGSTECMKKPDIIKNAIAKSDFTMEDLAITEQTAKCTKSEALDNTAFIGTLEGIECAKEIPVEKEFAHTPVRGAEFTKKSRHTDIIKEAIEISDFTMEDLQITEYTENAIGSADSAKGDIREEIPINTFECPAVTEEIVEDSNFIESLDNTDKAIGNTDIIKEAIDSAFTIEDLGITVGSTVPKIIHESTEMTDESHKSRDFMEALGNTAIEKEAPTELSDKILDNIEFREKALDNMDMIKNNTIESSDFSIEDLGLAEYTEDALETTGYTMEDLGITECPEELENTDYIQEALCSTEIVKKTPGNIEFAEALPSTDFTDSTLGFIEDLGHTHYTKASKTAESADLLEDALKRTDFTEEALRSTEFEEELGSTHFKEALGNTECPKEAPSSTELTDEVIRNDIIKETIENSEFTMQGLSITYTENEFLKTNLAMDEMIDNSEALNVELLNCLKCGVDFKNDVDLHTHLCGGEMTLFLDFQDM